MTQPPLPHQQPDHQAELNDRTYRGAGKSQVFENALTALRNGTDHATIYTDDPALLDAGARPVDELKTAAAPERAVVIIQDESARLPRVADADATLRRLVRMARKPGTDISPRAGDERRP